MTEPEISAEGSATPSSFTVEILSTTLASTSLKGEATEFPTVEITSSSGTTLLTEDLSTTETKDEATSMGINMTTAESLELIRQNETSAAIGTTTRDYATENISVTSKMIDVTSSASTTEGSGEVRIVDGQTTIFTVKTTSAGTPVSTKVPDTKEEADEPSFLNTITSPTLGPELIKTATDRPLLETTPNGSGMSSSQSTKVLSSTREKETALMWTSPADEVTFALELDVTTPGIIVLNETADITTTKKAVTDLHTDFTKGTELTPKDTTLSVLNTEGSGTLTPSSGITTSPESAIPTSALSSTGTLQNKTMSSGINMTTAKSLESIRQNLTSAATSTRQPIVEATSTQSTTAGSGKMTPFVHEIGESTIMFSIGSDVKKQTEGLSFLSTTALSTDDSGMSSPKTDVLSTSPYFVVKETTDSPWTTKFLDVTESPRVDITTRIIPGLIILNETTDASGNKKVDFSTDITASTEQPIIEETGYSTDERKVVLHLTTEATMPLTSEGSGTVTPSTFITERKLETETSVTPTSLGRVQETTEEYSFLSTPITSKTTQDGLFEPTKESSKISSYAPIEISNTSTTESKKTPEATVFSTLETTGTSPPTKVHSTLSKPSPTTNFLYTSFTFGKETVSSNATKSAVEDVRTTRPQGLSKQNETSNPSSTEKMVTSYSTEERRMTSQIITNVTASEYEASGERTTFSGISTANKQDITDITATSSKKMDLRTTEEPIDLRTTFTAESTTAFQTTKDEELFQTTFESSGMSSSPTIEIMSTTFTTPKEITPTDVTRSPVKDMGPGRPPGLIKQNETSDTASTAKMMTGYSTEQTEDTTQLVAEITSLGSTPDSSGQMFTSSGISTSYKQNVLTGVTPTSSKKVDLRTTEESIDVRTTISAESTMAVQTTKEEELFETTFEGSGISSSPTTEIMSTTFTTQKETTPTDVTRSPPKDRGLVRPPGLIKQNETSDTASTPKMVTRYSTEQTKDTTQLVAEITSLGSTPESSGQMFTSSGSSTAYKQTGVTPTSSKKVDLRTTEETIDLRTTISAESTMAVQTTKEEELFETTFEGSGMSSSPTIGIISTFTTPKEITPAETTRSPVRDLGTVRPPGLIKQNETSDTASTQKMVTRHSTEQTKDTTKLVAELTSFGTTPESSGQMTTFSGSITAYKEEMLTAITPTSSSKKVNLRTTEETIDLRTTISAESKLAMQTTKEEELFETTFEGRGMPSSPTIKIMSTTFTTQKETTPTDVTRSPPKDRGPVRPPGLIKQNETSDTASTQKMVTRYSTEQTEDTTQLVAELTSFGTTPDSSGQMTTSIRSSTAYKEDMLTDITPKSSSKKKDVRTTEERYDFPTTITAESFMAMQTKEEELFQTTFEGSGMSSSPTIDILSTTFTTQKETTPTNVTRSPVTHTQRHKETETTRSTDQSMITNEKQESIFETPMDGTGMSSPSNGLVPTSVSMISEKASPSANEEDESVSTVQNTGKVFTPELMTTATEIETEGTTLKPSSESTTITPSLTLITTEKLGVQELQGKETTTQLHSNTGTTQSPTDTTSKTTVESPTSGMSVLSSVSLISNINSGQPREVTRIPTGADMEQFRSTIKSISMTSTAITTDTVTEKLNEVERYTAFPSKKPMEELGSGFTGEASISTTSSKPDLTVSQKQSSTWFTTVKELDAHTSSSRGISTKSKPSTGDSVSSTLHSTMEIFPSASATLLTSLKANRTVPEDDDSKVTELQEPSTRSPENEKYIIPTGVASSSTIPTTNISDANTITSVSHHQKDKVESTKPLTSSPRTHTTLKQSMNNNTVMNLSTASSKTTSGVWDIITSRTPDRIVSEQTDQNDMISTTRSSEIVTLAEEIDFSTPRMAVTELIIEGIHYITNLTMETLGGIFTTSQPPVTSSSTHYDSNETEIPSTPKKMSTLSRIIEAASTSRGQTMTTAEVFTRDGSGDESTTASRRSQQPPTLFTLLRTNLDDKLTTQSKTTAKVTNGIRIPSTPPPPPPYPPMTTLQPPAVDRYTSSPPSPATRGLPSATATPSFTSGSRVPVTLVATTDAVPETTEEQDGYSGDMDGESVAVPAYVHLHQPAFITRIRECGQCGKEICPVCGTNGVTYQSECKLNQTACLRRITDLEVAYQGECINGFLDLVNGDISCQDFECPITYNPVCGSDNRTYTNSCELQKATLCSEGSASVEKISDGVCKTNS